MGRYWSRVLFYAGLSLLVTSVIAGLTFVILIMIVRCPQQQPTGNFGEEVYYSKVLKITQHTSGHIAKSGVGKEMRGSRCRVVGTSVGPTVSKAFCLLVNLKHRMGI